MRHVHRIILKCKLFIYMDINFSFLEILSRHVNSCIHYDYMCYKYNNLMARGNARAFT
jgi:hypothetical protein